MMELVGAFRDYAKAPIHAEILGSKYLQPDSSLDLLDSRQLPVY